MGALAAVILPVPGRTTSAPAASLDGAGNNLEHSAWGRAGSRYVRVAPARYADGVGTPLAGPPARYVSNRVFNDVGQNLFSENGVSQWGWVWGQFVDHDIGLRVEKGGEKAPIAFARDDALEDFTNDLGTIDFSRTPAARGTGVSSPREHVNTLSSYIDGSGVYGVDDARLDWLRAGPSTATRRTTKRACCFPTASCRAPAAAATRAGAPRRSSSVRSPAGPTRRASPATCA